MEGDGQNTWCIGDVSLISCKANVTNKLFRGFFCNRELEV